MSKVHNISFNEAKKIRGDEFLNTWAYIDGKIKLEKRMIEEAKQASRARR